MKKSTKVWLIVAGAMLAVGLFIVAIGWRMGGRYSVVRWIANGDLSIGPADIWGFNGWNVQLNGDNIRLDGTHEKYSGDVSDRAIAGDTAVTGLDIQVGGGAVYLTEASDNQYHISSTDAPTYQCYVSDSTLYLLSPSVNVDGDCKIYLAVPKNQDMDSIMIAIGGGILTADSLKADTLDIDLGAGQITIDALESENVTMDIGAGKADIMGGVVENASISVGMGAAYYTGRINGDLDADCSMGEMNFQLDGEERDHNYDVECAMGEVRIGSSSMSGIGNDREFDNGADSDFTLNCSMGSLKVMF